MISTRLNFIKMLFIKKRIPKHLILENSYSSKKRLSKKNNIRVWGILIILSITLIFIINAKVKAEPNLDAETGQLIFTHTAGQHVSSLHLETKIIAKISGMVAQVTYEQHFRNDSPDWKEAIYLFPLPEDAAVNFMQIQMGQRIIVGEIKEKTQAKEIYKKAKKLGKRAALTEQQRPNMFTQKIANIAPNESIVITLGYLHKVDYDSGNFSWRLPTTFTPRYAPELKHITEHEDYAYGSNVQANYRYDYPEKQYQQNNLIKTGYNYEETMDSNWLLSDSLIYSAEENTPYITNFSINQKVNPISIHIDLDSGLELSNIEALYHDIKIKKQKNDLRKTHQITLSNKEEMNRDFVLQWSPVNNHMPQAAVFTETVKNEDYALVMVLPPQDKKKMQALARDIIFIIDTSGSMQGSSIVQAKNSLIRALENLTSNDRFNIIEFNSQHKRIFSELRSANQQNIQYALNWIGRLQANGGTEMLSALHAAFKDMKDSNYVGYSNQSDKENIQQIVFITDGAVSNEKKLFHSISTQLNNTRLFTVGIGTAPNSYFMKKAAEFGRGSFIYIQNQEDVSKKMDHLFTKLENAVATDLSIEWDVNSEQYPKSLSDLYFGEPLLVSSKLAELPSSILVKGKLANNFWKKEILLSSELKNNNQKKHTGVASIWARSKIEQIEDEGIIGKKNQQEIKEEILDLALTHKLLSRFTSFIAVDNTPIRLRNEKLKKQLVSNQVAKGQKFQSIVYPKSATNWKIFVLFGMISLVGFIFIVRKKVDDQVL